MIVFIKQNSIFIERNKQTLPIIIPFYELISKYNLQNFYSKINKKKKNKGTKIKPIEIIKNATF